MVITTFSFTLVSWSACEGDINCDGVTDGSGLALFAADYGTTGCGNCDAGIARIEKLENKIVDLRHFSNTLQGTATTYILKGQICIFAMAVA